MEIKNHLAFALSSFYPDHRAGTETYVLNLSKELIKLGYRVSVIIPSVGRASSQYEYEGIRVYSFKVPLKTSPAEMNGLHEPSGLDEFKRLLQQIKPDIFHLHTLSRSMHAEHLKTAGSLGIKTVFTSHLSDNFCVRGNLMRFGKIQCNGLVGRNKCLACYINQKKSYSPLISKISSFFLNLFFIKSPLISKYPAFRIIDFKLEQISKLAEYSDHNIALGSWLEEIYKLNGLKKTSIIKQGVDAQFIKIKEVIPYNLPIKLGFIGRMHPLKNIDLLLSVLKTFHMQFDLMIITIPFEDELEYYKKVKNEYHAIGFNLWFENLDKKQVAEKLELVDLLVLPSKYEAAPLVIIEAFAKKIPVIASDYIAMKEMVQHNVNGLLFKNGDGESLKEQLTRLINEPELIQKLSQNIEPVRSFRKVAEEHNKIYRELKMADFNYVK
ncbi:MAG: glycosyltransferase [Bacteroidales bacterium]